MRALLILCYWLLVACSDADFSTSTSDGASGSSATAAAGATATGGASTRSSSATAAAGATTTGGSSSSSSSATAAAGAMATGGASTRSSVARIVLVAAGAAVNPSIQTTIELVNVSETDWIMSEFRLRYWFTAESQTASMVPEVGDGALYQRVSIGAVIPARERADHYIEIQFSGGTLLAGATEQLTFRAHQSDWSEFDQLDDYSYPAGISGDELVTVGLFRNGVLIAGAEP